MKLGNINILTINAGSSSIKFALFTMQEELVEKLSANIDRIGIDESLSHLKVNNKTNNLNEVINTSSFKEATISLMDWLEQQTWFHQVSAVGHRVVYGMQHQKAEMITESLLKDLNQGIEYDPDHMPAEIFIIQLLKQKHPQLLQVACFDTAFHTTIPAVAKTFAIPKKYFDEGIQRYGFHGISYSYLMEQLVKQNPTIAYGKIILAHLGNGASIAAVKNGKCVDTSMGFTPAGGIVMSTRSGDLDPGIAWYFMQKGMDAKRFNHLINHESGLLGLSCISPDMQDLLQQENANTDAALAIDIFCYQIKKYIGAYAAALGGLDTLVFSGGIGENAAAIRARVCEGMQYAGIRLNEVKNSKNERQISSIESAVKVYVIPTNEEYMMAKMTAGVYKTFQTNYSH